MTEALDFAECIGCEQLIFPGEEVVQTSDGLLCQFCVARNSGVALLANFA